MNTLAKLKSYFDQNNVRYEVILHEEVFTAQELAQALHTPGREILKSVVVKADKSDRMAVLPASRKIDLTALKAVLKARNLSLTPEQELSSLFPETEAGAMPPFGNLYNMEVCVDESVTHDEYIVFNAGTHYEAVRMRYVDFERLVLPGVARFSAHL